MKLEKKILKLVRRYEKETGSKVEKILYNKNHDKYNNIVTIKFENDFLDELFGFFRPGNLDKYLGIKKEEIAKWIMKY